jgi:hypothetical protein
MLAQSRLCETCRQVQPANKFLPSSLSPTGFLTKCLDCIRRTAEQHRIERARISQAAERRNQQDLLPAAQPIDLANMRPVGPKLTERAKAALVSDGPVRLPPALFEAAKRFVFEFRDGHTEHIGGEMEPELYALLEWLAEQSMLEADKRRKPEEVGREILGYRDANTSRGVAYGALWAALVRAAAVYRRANSKMIDVTQADPSRLGKRRRRG